MASVTSPTNTNSRDLDSLVLVSSGASKIKRAVAGTNQTASGITPDTHAEAVGTHANAATYAATDPIVLVAVVADDTSPTSMTEGQVGYVRGTLSHKMLVNETADAAAVTSVASLATSATILAANAARVGCIIDNSDANALFIKYGATATTTTSYTVKIAAGANWTMPLPTYRGIIDGIWAADGSGAAQVTELT